MDDLATMTYGMTGSIARITLNRPKRGNGITLGMPRELERCVEAADLDPAVLEDRIQEGLRILIGPEIGDCDANRQAAAAGA